MTQHQQDQDRTEKSASPNQQLEPNLKGESTMSDTLPPQRSAYAFPIYACETCWHGESALSVHNKVITACPKCAGTMREVGIPSTDAPGPCDLLCLVCARFRPWGIWDSVSGVAVCIECRDKARATPPYEERLTAARELVMAERQDHATTFAELEAERAARIAREGR